MTPETFQFTLRKGHQLRQTRRREGCYLLRSNLTSTDPALLWRYYIQFTEIEQAFKELKSDLSLRPIYHQLDHGIEAPIFVAFIAYCLQVTLKFQARQLAPGRNSRGEGVIMQTVNVRSVTPIFCYNPSSGLKTPCPPRFSTWV